MEMFRYNARSWITPATCSPKLNVPTDLPPDPLDVMLEE